MYYSALNVAEYIIQRCNDQGKLISNLKLQKILYFVQAEFLVAIGDVCFKDEIVAWDFGPVVPCVYHRYKVYGSASIPCLYDYDQYRISNADLQIMNGIIDECARLSASQLVDITHSQTPWQDAYRSFNKIITPESIRRYFTEE